MFGASAWSRSATFASLAASFSSLAALSLPASLQVRGLTVTTY
jgi:hypothetical protein